MTTLHVLPMIQTTVNEVLTDMELVQEDWRQVLLLGFIYIPVNAVGQWCYKTPLYPETDWVTSPLGAFGTLILMAGAQSLGYFLFAKGLKAFKTYLDAKA